MPHVLQSISLYNYQAFWRHKNDTEVNHKCGGFLTLLIIIFLVIITVYQFNIVSKRSNVTSSLQTQVDFIPPLTNFTTSQNDPNSTPSMIAINLNSRIGETAFDLTDITIQATYNGVVQEPITGIYLLVPITITMQQCTKSHFSTLPEIQSNYANWNVDNWLCLPLNQTYSLGGNQIIGNYWYISLKVVCSNAANCQSGKKSLTVDLLTLDTFTNPANTSQPFMTYLNKKTSIIQSGTSITNSIYIDQHILKTDNSLTPIQSFSNLSSLITKDAMNTYSFSTTVPTTEFLVYRSGQTVTYTRNYMKILQALSFVGGLFAPLSLFISIFFCMSRYGRLIYEMNLADRCFRDSQTKVITNLNYGSFIKQVAYNIVKVFKQPDWQLQKKRAQYKRTINGMLDVFYLQKRLHFLEKCITILFKKHQLKGLYLLHSQSREEAEQKRQNYKFREKMLTFFKNNPGNIIRQSKPQIILKPDYQKIRKKRMELLQSEEPLSPKIKIDIRQQLKDQKVQKQELNSGSHKKICSADVLIRQQNITQPNHQPPINTCRDSHIDFEDEFNEEFYQCEMQSKSEIKQALSSILLLYKEANDHKGDKRSKKIFNSLDDKMQNKIMRIAEQHLYQQYLSL